MENYRRLVQAGNRPRSDQLHDCSQSKIVLVPLERALHCKFAVN